MISLFVLDKILSNFEKKHELKQTKVICLIEETRAVLEVNELAKHPRVEALLLGAEDLTNELEIQRSIKGDEIQFARSQVIYAAIANKIIPIDTPFTDISDTEGLEWDCQNAQSLGMKAKTAIHPNQLEKINEIFSPNIKMIEWAKGVVDLAEKSGKGVFQYKGKMIDKPVIDKAYKILEKAKFFDLM